MEHTPGPWKTEGFEKLVVNGADGSTIVCAPGSSTGTLLEMKANARLIAAVPEAMQELETLAEYVELALRELNDQDTGWYYQLKQHAQQARKILAKAKGAA